MQKNDYNHFQLALKDFEELKKYGEIPPQMLVKLEYLILKIYQKQPKVQANSQLPDLFATLPEYQRNSLDQISKETGIQLFVNIINCLSGKDTVVYVRNQKMYIRKDQTLSMWHLCYGSIDNRKIIVYKKPVDNVKNGKNNKKAEKPMYQLELEYLRVSKNFKDYKRKSVFGVCYRKKNSYLIGFDQQSACARTHELIRSLIKEKLRKKNIEAVKKSQTNNGALDQSSMSRVTYNRRSFDQGNNDDDQLNSNVILDQSYEQQKQQYMERQYEQAEETSQNKQQNPHKTAILQYIKKQQLLCDQSFKLARNDENIRELIHKKYPNIIKQIIIIDKKNLDLNEGKDTYIEMIMQSYLLQNQWNQEIQDLQIHRKLSENLYAIIIRTKKYSYLSYTRSCQVFAMGLVLQNGVRYLVLRSSDDDSNINNDSVKMEWNQIVEIRQAGTKILVTVLSEFDFKGYASMEDSQKMGMKLMKSLEKFGKFVETQSIYQKEKYIFKLEVPLDKSKRQSTDKMKKKYKNSDEGSTGQGQKSMRKYSQQSEYSQNGSVVSRASLDNDNKLNQKKNGNTVHYSEQMPKMIQTQDKDINFLALKVKQENQLPSDQLIQAIRNKTFERYYLHHKFSQEIKLDLSRHTHQVVTKDNYISQGGIFTIREGTGDVVYYDPVMVELQKGIIKMIIKQLSSNIMSGKSIMNMSLPVEIFDNRSILERIAMGFGYFPRFLTEAGNTQDIIKQAQLVTLAFMGILPLHLNVTKPFNPILGETFQCYIGGIPIYLEQVSHHPPITALYIKTDSFTVHGCFHSYAEMGLNQVQGRNLCPIFVEFPLTNTHYELKMNDMEITGIMYGDKMYRGLGKSYIYEKTNNIYIEYSFGKDKKKVYQMPKGEKMNANTVIGGIYTVTQSFGKKFMSCQNKRKFEGLKPDEIVSKHTEIKGHWALDMYFNGVKVKSMTDPIPNKVEYPDYVLPSDSNFRLDLLYKKRNDYKIANEEKEILENIQRRDRKLREEKAK